MTLPPILAVPTAASTTKPAVPTTAEAARSATASTVQPDKPKPLAISKALRVNWRLAVVVERAKDGWWYGMGTKLMLGGWAE